MESLILEALEFYGGELKLRQLIHFVKLHLGNFDEVLQNKMIAAIGKLRVSGEVTYSDGIIRKGKANVDG